MEWQPLELKEEKRTYEIPYQVSSLFIFIVANLSIPLAISQMIEFDYEWYEHLIKPSFIPPVWFFGQITWIVLDILIALSGWVVYIEGRFNGVYALAYILQAVFHCAWMPVFFAGKQLLIALLDSLLQLLSLVSSIVLYRKVNKWASLLLVPALTWVSVAAVFNAALWYLNQK